MRVRVRVREMYITRTHTRTAIVRFPMAYTSLKTLTFEEFLTQYRDNPRYELADGELIDMEPTGPIPFS